MQQHDKDNSNDVTVAKPVQLQILLADDSRVIQAQLARVLKSLGHEVTIVTTGLAAFEITGKKRFDLVFMDLEMPEMDGVEATLAIRKREHVDESRTRIIAMSANSSDALEQRCLSIGMDSYITKPVNMKTIQKLCSTAGDGPQPAITSASL
jgi:CheY-like chemotaxis protein